jgi:hypothetical protein
LLSFLESEQWNKLLRKYGLSEWSHRDNKTLRLQVENTYQQHKYNK